MAFDPHRNLAYSTVATAPSPASSGTSITLTSAADFPDPGAQGYDCTVWETGAAPLLTNAEIVRVTAKVGDVLTITRAQGGTSARTIVVGDQFAMTVTARNLTDIEDAIPSVAGLISAINVSAGLQANNLSALTFGNGNGVSFGLNGSVVTATVVTNYQSQGAYLTTAALSQDSSKYAGTNGAITGGSITVNTSGVSVNLPAYLTTAMQSDAVTLSNIKVSAGASSAHLSAVTFSNSNGLAFGLSQGTITGSYTVPTVTAGSDTAGISNLGNTSGTSGVISGDAIRLLFAGGNNITLSQSINGVSATITISGANVGGAQTGISGIVASDATYASGTVTFSGVGGGATVRSNTGQRIDISVAAQTVQTQNLIALSLDGNTAGALALVSSGTAILAGGNNITLSQDGQSITISGANAGGAQTGISGMVVSDATYTSGTVSFSNQANITIGSSVDGATQYIRLSGHAAQTVQTQSLIAGLYDGANSISTGTVRLTNANGVSFTINGQTLSGSVATTYLASNASTNYVQANANFAGTNATGTIASNGISVSVAAPIPIGTAVKAVASIGSTGTITRYAPEDHQHAGVAAFAVTNTGNTLGNTRSQVGTLFLAASGAITASQSTAAAGNDTVWFSVAAQSVQTQSLIAGIYDGANSISTGTIRFTNANGVSFSINGQTLSGSVATTYLASNASTNYVQANAGFAGTNATGTIASSGISVSVAAQTNQTLGLYAVSNTTGESSSSTFDARTLSFHGAGIASIGYSNGSVVVSVPAGGGGLSNIRVSAGTTSNLLSALTFADSNGVSFGINASTITATVSTYSTVGTATTGYPVASANSVGTVTRWAAEDHRHAGIGALGISTAGNTAGTTGSVQGTYWFQGGNNFTVSQITSNNGSHTLVLSGPPQFTASFYANLDRFIDAASTTLSAGVSALQVVPFVLPHAISGLFMRVPVSMSHVSSEFSGTTANTTWTVNRGYTQAVAIMTQNGGASSLSLAYSTSTAATWNFQNVVGAGAQGSRYTVTQNVSYPVSGTTSNYTTSYAQSSANVQLSSASMTLFTGPRFVDIPFAISLSAGNYWAAFGVSTSSGTTGGANAAAGNVSMGFSTVGVSHSALTWGRPGEVTASSIHILPGLGSWSTNAAVMSSSSLQLASISIQASHPHLYFQIQRFA